MKKRDLSRRDLLGKGVGLAGSVGIVAAIGCERAPKESDKANAQGGLPMDAIAVASGGKGPGERVEAAVKALGGMGAVVKPGMKIAILPNSQKDNPGTFTHPDVVKKTIELIFQAGAAKVDCLTWLPEKYWKATGLDKVVKGAGANLFLVPTKEENAFKEIPTPRGKALKSVKLMKALLKADGLINLPITKHHVGNNFTGSLKNAMGLNFYLVNRIFHKEDKKGPQWLDQCIADLNLAVKPLLNIVDATEIILTNGPFGPGRISKPGKIVAGVDRVAVDSYCTRFVGRKPDEIVMIKRAFEHGLGQMNLARVKIIDVKGQ